MSEISQVAAQLIYSVPPPKGVRAQNKVVSDPLTGERKVETNIGTVAKEVIIENLRGKEDTVSIDKSGFQFFHHESQHKSFSNEEEIKAEYYPESIELLKKLTGASRVVVFDHTVRRRAAPGIKPISGGPAARVHGDQTTKASITRVHRHLPAEDVPKLLEKRFQVINLWRPIHHTADDWPLALCDYRSVSPEDTFPASLINVSADYQGETLGVTYNENHRWKYLKGMTTDEIILIKCFDSIQDGSVAVFTPHTGFQDPTTPADAIPRESIELRALVFYD